MATRDLGRGLMGEFGFARAGVIAVMMIVALALQTALLPQLTILGVIPQLVLIVVVTLAYLDGEPTGVITGFAGGLLLDLQPLQSIVGLTALLYTLIGYAVGRVGALAPREGVWTPLFIVATATAVAEFGYAAMSVILGQQFVGFSLVASRAGLVVLYNTLLTPFAFPLIRRLDNRFRTDRIVRW